MSPRHLINATGEPFDDLDEVRAELSSLANGDRTAYRDSNAAAVAADTSSRTLVVAGPGAGKSYLFIARIKEWLSRHADGRVYVATFVRKLIRDLEGDVAAKLEPADAGRVETSTLHDHARSLLGRSRGTSDVSLGQYVRIADGAWATVVWADALAFAPDLEPTAYSFRQLEGQLHSEAFDESAEWRQLREIHAKLTSFYGAVGFAQSIVLARQAVEEAPTLVDHDLWIIDEYQDFNAAEDHLVRLLIEEAAGVLIAGDDEQALYQTLKGSTPEIIVGYYNDAAWGKAMLPFCSRCGYFICTAASDFMALHRDENAIDKIYLPLVVDEEAPRVQIVAATTPSAAVAYVAKFMEEHTEAFDEYLKDREAGRDTDPFLLILSPSGGLTPRRNDAADEALAELVAEYASQAGTRSSDYAKVSTFATAGWYEGDNFAVRQMLHLAEVSVDDVHPLVKEALEQEVRLAEVVDRHMPLMEVARQCAAALDDSGGDAEQAVGRIEKLIAVDDPGALVTELGEHPLTQAEIREREDEDAISTAAAIAPVALMSITGSKGLSAHHVIVLGCDDVNMGKTSPLTFFVALTRARETLHLVFAAKASGAKSLHEFVLEVPEEVCDHIVVKTDGSVEPADDRDALLDRIGKWSYYSGR